jgi:Arc/MetJ-type ribon-helix-helix transcriptional regulator
MRKLKTITVHLPEAYFKALDELIERGLFPSRSEAVRAAIRDLLRKELSEPIGGKKTKEVR